MRARSRARAQAAAVQVPVRRARLEPVRGDLPAAVVPHHARGERAARRRTPRRSSTALGEDRDRDDRRARVRQRREDRRPRRSAAGARAAPRACTSSTFRRRRSSRPSSGSPASARLGRRPPVDLRGRAAPRGRGARPATVRCSSCCSARTSATSMRRRRSHFLRRIRLALQPGDLLLLGADLVKPERELLLAYDDPLGVTAAFNKNLLVRINRELGGDVRSGRLRSPRGLERSGAAHRDAPRQPHRRRRVPHHGARHRRSRSAAASASGPRARTSTSRTDRAHGASRPASRCAISGSTKHATVSRSRLHRTLAVLYGQHRPLNRIQRTRASWRDIRYIHREHPPRARRDTGSMGKA